MTDPLNTLKERQIMSKPLVYVAGPIAGQDYDGATKWRSFVQSQLPECEILTPMRGKEWLQQFAEMPLTAQTLMEFSPKGETADLITPLEQQMSSEKGILRRDTWDVSRCNLIFANFLPGDEDKKVSIGTSCEVYLAGVLHTPVVAMLEQGGIHDHPFITGSSWVVVHSVEEGIMAARIVLNLGVKGAVHS